MSEATARPFRCIACGWEAEIPEHKPRRCGPCNVRRTRSWRDRNPEKAHDLDKRMGKKERTERREQYNARRRRNRKPHVMAASRRRRVEWLLAGDTTREELIAIYEAASGLCHYCDKPVRARFSPHDPRGFDHVQPRAKDGKHTAANIVVCCRSCNELKSDGATVGVRG